MPITDYFQDRIKALKKDLNDEILSLLKKENISSIHFTPYMTSSVIDYRIFPQAGNDGEPIALTPDTLTIKDGTLLLDMDHDEGYYGQKEADQLSCEEQLEILRMIHEIISWSAARQMPVLPEGKDFDDYARPAAAA